VRRAPAAFALRVPGSRAFALAFFFAAFAMRGYFAATTMISTW
jgi:hypothetical protein